jgi:ferredoxin-NADP reductase
MTRIDSPAARPRLATRVRGGTLRVLEAVTTPLLPTDYLDLVDPLRSGAALRGRIEEVRPETADAATLLIRPGRGWAGHVPGQYVRVGVDVDGVRLWRAYSVTSGPRADGRISITVKVIPGGRVSTHLVRHATPGTIVQLDQATGDFRLPDPAPARILFVTAGSGITPVMGMLRHHLSGLSDVTVVHSAPTADHVIFGAVLRDMATAGRIRLLERHTDGDGLLTPDQLARLVPDWDVRQTWACGPTAMLDDLEAHWASAGAGRRLHTERFRPHVLVTGDGGTVSFTATGRTVEADGATPLLDVGETSGVLMPSGCRMGICFGCVAPLRSGAVRDLRSGTLTTAEPGDGVQVQTCISAAAGPCEIDL